MKVMPALKEFQLHCKIEKQLSVKTLRAYSTDLLQAFSFLNPKVEISRFDIVKYYESICHLKPRSIKRKMASLKVFFNYLEAENKVQINPFHRLKFKVREPQELRTVMDVSEVKRILKRTYSIYLSMKEGKGKFRALRNLVVVELLFATGARVSEISNLKNSDVNLDTGVVKILGKGRKERYIRICNKETLEILHQYRLQMSIGVNNIGGWFLVNNRGHRLSDQSIRNMVTLISKKANINKRVTPHVFRHTFATLLLENKVDLKYIQSFLGHSSITTTQIYTHVNTKQQHKILSSLHPREGITIVRDSA